MVLSFVYLAFVSLLKLLIGSGRRVDVKDVELLVLRHQLEGLRRQGQRPKLRPSDRALLVAMGGLLAPARRHGLLVRCSRSCRHGRRPIDTETPKLVFRLGARELALGVSADRRGAQQARPGRLAEHGSPRAGQRGPWSGARALWTFLA